jgi:hypothetical protein
VARDALCVACVDAGHGSFDVPWERRDGVLATVRAQWLERAFFARLPGGDARGALLYAFAAHALVLTLFVLAVDMLPSTATDAQPAPCTGLAAALGLTPTVVFPVAMVIFIAARVLGARTDFTGILRAVSYAQGYALGLIPWEMLVPLGPELGRLIVFGLLGLLLIVLAALQVRAVAAFLEGRGGLSRTRALVAASSPAVLIGCLMIVWAIR